VAALVTLSALRADHAVLPLQKSVEVFQRQAEQLQEYSAWKRHSELLVEVAFAPIREPVDHLVHQFGDPGFSPGHLPRGGQRIEDATVLRVLRRIDLQRKSRRWPQDSATGTVFEADELAGRPRLVPDSWLVPEDRRLSRGKSGLHRAG